MVTKKIKIRKTLFTFVFRHRYEKRDAKYDIVWSKDEWKISLWFRKFESRHFSKIVIDRMVGFELLFFKTWLTISKA